MGLVQIATETELLEVQWRDRLLEVLALAHKLAHTPGTIERADTILALQKYENQAKAHNDWSLLPEVRHREGRILELEQQVEKLEREKWSLEQQIRTMK